MWYSRGVWVGELATLIKLFFKKPASYIHIQREGGVVNYNDYKKLTPLKAG